MMFIKLDLPDPDGPLTAINSPDEISNETPRRAWTLLCPSTYVLWTSCTTMTSWPWLSAFTTRETPTSRVGIETDVSADGKEIIVSGVALLSFIIANFLLLHSYPDAFK